MPQRLMTALQLAWDASRGRSLFAARCLVAAALQLYARGATADDVQLALSFAGQEHQPSCLVMRACREISEPAHPSGSCTSLTCSET